MTVTEIAKLELQGQSLIAGAFTKDGGASFQAFSPVDGAKLDPVYRSANLADVESAVAAAVSAAKLLVTKSGKERAGLLRRIADGIDQASQLLVDRAHAETALPRPRLTGEVARTSNQLRFFADVAEEGSWLMARIDTADAGRTPPKPDIRSMLRPLGPVVVFGASNFPLAFSVAGGDTASALAAGNPVIVKAHPAHPATGELVAQIIAKEVAANAFPPGTFSLLFDAGHDIGAALVQHSQVRAVGFTGSFRGGRALMDLAAQRREPIPVYAEMGSTNPVFVLPGALRERSDEVAAGLHASFTLGGGQFCTKPGLVFADRESDSAFAAKLRSLTGAGSPFSLLTGGIAEVYGSKVAHRHNLVTASGAPGSEGFKAQVALMETDYNAFARNHELSEEVFGPTTLIVHCAGQADLLEAAHNLDGHLTATILGTEKDLQENSELLEILETRVGRVIFNGFPTGVEVCHAMVHGGPYPATSDGRSTSVGSQAIFRFARPVAYQGMPQSALPAALRDDNPESIRRLQNGAWIDPK